jgi:lysozyme
MRLTAYQDIKGIWTVGVGHTGKDVHPGLKITEEQAVADGSADD